MGIWNRIFGREVKSTTTSEAPANWFVDWIRGGTETTAGVAVTPESAMRLAAVWACVKVRSEDIGKLPCFLYRREPDGGKVRATTHSLFSLIRDQPNPYQTAFEFRQLMQAWVDLRGNAYAMKEVDLSGKITALWPLNPMWVTVLRVPESFELFYQIRIPGGQVQTVPAEGIMHLRGLTLDGYCGVSPITYHRETIGLGIAAQRYGSAFFGNSAQPNGGIKLPYVLEKPAADALRAQWEQRYRGSENAGSLAIFDGGMEWVQTGMNNTDAQYLEARSFQNREIWRMFRMPPHKVGDLDKATNNNIEHQALEYVTDCLMTEMVRWEQTLKRDLLTSEEKKVYFFEFLPDALLRGDFASRMAGYAVARNWGIFNVDEIRERENLNHLPDKQGEIYLQPLNMVEAGTPPPPVLPAPPPKLPAPAADDNAVKAFENLAGLIMSRDELRDADDATMRQDVSRMGERVSDALRLIEASVRDKKLPDINVQVAAPDITVNVPERDVTVNVPEREVNVTVPEREVRIDVNAAPEPVGEEFEVLQHSEDGRVTRWKKTPTKAKAKK